VTAGWPSSPTSPAGATAASTPNTAGELQRQLRLDLSNGSEREQRMAQLWLEFGVDRSLYKGPVMTTIYGARFLGVVEGLVATLEDRQAGLGVGRWQAAYLAPAPLSGPPAGRAAGRRAQELP